MMHASDCLVCRIQVLPCSCSGVIAVQRPVKMSSAYQDAVLGLAGLGVELYAMNELD